MIENKTEKENSMVNDCVQNGIVELLGISLEAKENDYLEETADIEGEPEKLFIPAPTGLSKHLVYLSYYFGGRIGNALTTNIPIEFFVYGIEENLTYTIFGTIEDGVFRSSLGNTLKTYNLKYSKGTAIIQGQYVADDVFHVTNSVVYNMETDDFSHRSENIHSLFASEFIKRKMDKQKIPVEYSLKDSIKYLKKAERELYSQSFEYFLMNLK